MLAAEVVPFGFKLNKLAEAFSFTMRCLSSLRQILESHGDREGQIGKTLDQMLPAVSDANIILEDVRAVIGQAHFVEAGNKKGPLQ